MTPIKNSLYSFLIGLAVMFFVMLKLQKPPEPLIFYKNSYVKAYHKKKHVEIFPDGHKIIDEGIDSSTSSTTSVAQVAAPHLYHHGDLIFDEGFSIKGIEYKYEFESGLEAGVLYRDGIYGTIGAGFK